MREGGLLPIMAGGVGAYSSVGECDCVVIIIN